MNPPKSVITGMARERLLARRAKQDKEQAVKASLEAAQKQAETKKMSNAERRELLKALIAKENEP